MNKDPHCFVVPAYGESPYLEQCLSSLEAQTLFSRIVVVSSTPFEGVEALCSRYGAEFVAHAPNAGIASDWNAALANAGAAGWVTVAHQDDVYLPRFAERTMAAVDRHPQAVLAFTGYAELDSTGIRPKSLAMRVKSMLIGLAMQGRSHVNRRWSKTNLLRFGCPIGCPAVTLRLAGFPDSIRFDGRYRVNLDWDLWLRLAQEVPGGFICLREVLMHHRIHEASETTAGITDGVRAREDLELFSRLWPKPVAVMLARAYSLSYSFNRS